MSKVHAQVIALSGVVALSSWACRPQTDNSNSTAIVGNAPIGKLEDKPNDVFIYYANETRPDAAEKENIAYVTGLMAQVNDEYVKRAAARIQEDTKEFNVAVDKDTSEIVAALCKNARNKRVTLLVFTNDMTRKGRYGVCENGGAYSEVASPELQRLYQTDAYKDFRYKSNPNAYKGMLEAAGTIAKQKYDPSKYAFSVVVKSHGSAETLVGVRMATRGDLIKSARGGEQRFKDALLDLVQEKYQSMDRIARRQLEIMPRVQDAIRGLSDASLKESLLKESLLKESLLKESLLKEGILKESILKEAILKESLLKESLLKESLLKESLLKESLLKEAILKEALLKEALLKEALLGTDDDLKGSAFLKMVSQPAVGITKDEFFSLLDRVDSSEHSKRMEFATLFLESCLSYLPDNIRAKVGEASWNPNIGRVFTSDQDGIDSYRSLDYKGFLARLDFTKPFAPQLANELDETTNGQH